MSASGSLTWCVRVVRAALVSLRRLLMTQESSYDTYEYTYSNTCTECGRRFTNTRMLATICMTCLDNLGLHIEEEDNDGIDERDPY